MTILMALIYGAAGMAMGLAAIVYAVEGWLPMSPLALAPPLKLEVHPTRPAWLAARRRSLGGSDSPKILGLSAWGDALSVYADKRGLLPEDATATEAAYWGLVLEPLVAGRYQAETDLGVEDPGRFTIVRNPAFPFLHVSPDRFIQHPTRGRGVLSIKTTSAYKAGDWTEEAPAAYQVRPQHELLVTGLDWGAIAVLIGGQTFKYIDCIERNAGFAQQLLQTLTAFWAACTRQEPPPPDASEACRAVLEALYPMETEQPIALPADLLAADARWVEAAGHFHHWEAQKRLAENELRAALRDAPKGVLPDGTAWSCTSQTRKEYLVPEATFRVLRRHTPKKG